MFTKILVLAVSVAIVSGSGYHYPQKLNKEYTHPYEHRIPVQEPSSEEYKPESQGHAYSSQSLVHQGHTLAYEEANGASAGHEPVYQYEVDEQSEDTAPVHKTPVQHKYQPHYPQHEIQAVRIPAYHKPAYYSDSYGVQKAPVYHSESLEHKGPYYHSETQEAQHQKVHEAPTYHVPHAPAHSEPHAHDEPIDYYAYPKYQYEYKVEDPHTGDNKFQHEIRDGDVVKGIYGLQDADGSFRTVEYSSDKHHGFSAIVKHSAPGQHVTIKSHHTNEHEHEN